MSLAVISFSGMPPIGPTVAVEVDRAGAGDEPAAGQVARASSLSMMPSANISPADGPPIRSSSAILTWNGAVLASVTPTPSAALTACLLVGALAAW